MTRNGPFPKMHSGLQTPRMLACGRAAAAAVGCYGLHAICVRSCARRGAVDRHPRAGIDSGDARGAHDLTPVCRARVIRPTGPRISRYGTTASSTATISASNG